VQSVRHNTEYQHRPRAAIDSQTSSVVASPSNDEVERQGDGARPAARAQTAPSAHDATPTLTARSNDCKASHYECGLSAMRTLSTTPV